MSSSISSRFACNSRQLAEALGGLGFKKIGRMRPWMFVRLSSDDACLVWENYVTTTQSCTATLLAELLAKLEREAAR